MKKGFTLVEMLVAMTVFVIVVTIASTIFVHAIRAQRLNLAYQELLDQTSYVMEYMSRSIRMAMKDDITVWGLPGSEEDYLIGDKVNYEFIGQCLKFRNYKNQCQEFCLVDAGGGRKKLVEIIDSGPQIDLTSTSSLDVRPLPPHLSWAEVSGERQTDGTGQPDTDQPLVTILLEIEGREGARIQIRTSISQRNLDTVK